MPCLRPSAGRDGLQPAPELGHLRRHGHELHVYGALLPAPRPPQPAVAALSPARCMHTPRSPAASRLPARSLPRTVCPACDPRQYARAFNQPLSWDTSRVTDMRYTFYVRCFSRAYPARPARKPAVAPSPMHAACTSRCSPPPASWPAARPAPCALLATLGSSRRPSISRWAGTLPASRTCATYLTCAAPRPLLPLPAAFRPLPCTACTPIVPVYPRDAARVSPHTSRVRPPCDSAERKLAVRRQQAAHPLCVGGHPRPRLRWL